MSLSVIIPTYQHASSLPRCLDSIFAQTRKPEEVIVVDDGSTDDTATALDPYLDRIVYIRQENMGAPVARNRGFDESTGDLVIFWDADVIGRPDMLERLESTLTAHSEASWAYSSFRWGRKLFQGKTFDAEDLQEQNFIHTTALIRRDAFPGFDPSLKRFQDWDLWLTMAGQGTHGIFVDEVLFEVLIEKDRQGYSQWLPSIAYKLPWSTLGWAPKVIRNHNEAMEVVRKKHQL